MFTLQKKRFEMTLPTLQYLIFNAAKIQPTLGVSAEVTDNMFYDGNL